MKCQDCGLNPSNINTGNELPCDTFYMCRSCINRIFFNGATFPNKWSGIKSYYRKSLGKKTNKIKTIFSNKSKKSLKPGTYKTIIK